jgi:hypothetical protein
LNLVKAEYMQLIPSKLGQKAIFLDAEFGAIVLAIVFKAF